jgi:ATP-binding cassette subfamily C (CFTR/MRP) protein 1
MGATIHFFETQPIGRILNRLTKDVVMIDLHIVLTVYLTVIAVLTVGCYLIFLLLIEYRMVFIIIPVLFLSMVITGFYRRFNMDLKRISSVSSSPLIAFMSESLEASDVVKSFGKVSDFVERQKPLIDNCLSKRFIHEMGGIWISLRLRVLFATLVLVISLLGLSSNTSAFFYGIGLVYSAELSNVVTLLVLAFNQLEATFNSIERLSYYINQLPQEPLKPIPGVEESKLVQMDSSITFSNVSFSYPSNPTKFVLKRINLEIQPGEKIGIVGRTGSGMLKHNL